MGIELHFENEWLDYEVNHQAQIEGGLEKVYSLFLQETPNYPNDYNELAKLESLKELIIAFDEENVDCSVFAPLKQISYLEITAMFCAWPITCSNLHALQSLEKLEILRISEFSELDLAEISCLTQLKEVWVCYGGNVEHIENVVNLPNLQFLWLVDINMKSLDFLNLLPSTVTLNLEFITVEEDFDINLLKRFENVTIEDVTIHGEKYEKL